MTQGNGAVWTSTVSASDSKTADSSTANPSELGTASALSMSTAANEGTAAQVDPTGNVGAEADRFYGEDHAVDEHLDSDEDLIEEMEIDEAEEMVGFADQVLGVSLRGATNASSGNDAEDSTDEPSTLSAQYFGDSTHRSRSTRIDVRVCCC